MNIFKRNADAVSLWNISGDFGQLKGSVEKRNDSYYINNGTVEALSEIKKDESGVCVRRGYVKNVSDKVITFSALSSKFVLDGGEYSVYTQYNGWQNESFGGWQELVTTVCPRCESVRNASGASPFAVLWNKQTERGIVFHLNACSAWEMRFSRVYAGGEAAYVEVELGVMKDGLSVGLLPGEEIELGEIMYYTASNKTDFDCHKLHSYLNKTYPRKSMPVIYNTWLYKFDSFTADDVRSQISPAKELGVEYFVIDAGWFGKGEEWWRTRGDWEENLTFGFRGEMKTIADEVRASGMKFGFWLEPETANGGTDIVKNHPEYFIEGDYTYFLDFSNSKAVDYIYEKTCELIDRYGAEFIKFDFNADMKYDIYHSGFLKYMRGHREYISRLKEKYPALYLENCASGGFRMAARDGALYDSFWLSDNQSPYEGLRIFKDTMLRMPPQWIECWAVICSAKGTPSPYSRKNEYADKLIACDDALWDRVAGVQGDFLKGFLTGSPVGFSCDLTTFDEKLFADLKKFVTEFKKDREFFKNAVCRILTDTDSMLVLEFADEELSEARIIIFTKKARQNNICVFPVLDENAEYVLPDGKVRGAKDISENGIDFPIGDSFKAQFMTLEKK